MMNMNSLSRWRYRAVAVLLALVCSAVLGSARLGAQSVASRHDGETIVAIEVEGSQLLPRETLLFYLKLEVGDGFDSQQFNRNLHKLWDRDLIDDLSIELLPEPGGVRVRVRVVERPVLRSIEYVGLKRLSRSDITDAIARQRIRVDEGVPLEMGELARLKAAIESLYRDKGFRFAQANYSMEDISPTERQLIVTIDEGDKVRIEDLDFEGNTVFSDRRLRFAMKKTKESGVLSRFRKRDIYNPATLEEDLDQIRKVYRDAGYKNITLGEPKIEVRAKKEAASDSQAQKRRLFVTLPVEEGSRWRLGEITFSGNETFPSDRLAKVFRKSRGEWLRADVIEEGVDAIRDAYNNSGFIFAEIDSQLVERDLEVADVEIRIREDDQFRVGRLEFHGNRTTKDKVLRREMRVREGVVFSSTALQNSLRRLQQLQFFAVDENDPVEFGNFDREKKTVDVTVKGEEGDRTELQFGAGWSELDGFFGQFSFRTRNFLGRGETLGIQAQSGRRRDIFDVSYFIPWFLDRPQSVGLQVFSRDSDLNLGSGQTFLQSTQGGTLTYGRNLKIFQSLSMNFSRFTSKDRQTLGNISGELTEFALDRSVSSFRPVYTFDNRDSVLAPTVGRRFSTSVEYAGGALGGDTEFVRPTVEFNMFLPVTKTRLKTVFGINLEAGLVEPLNGAELFALDRFFLGGDRSVRGFRSRAITVTDEDGNIATDENGFNLGGTRFVQANLEYHFVPRQGPIRPLLFIDFGNVYDEGQSIDFSGMRYSAGLELRVNVPVFGAPLRFIYAFNPDPLPGDRFETFQFSIGTTF